MMESTRFFLLQHNALCTAGINKHFLLKMKLYRQSWKKHFSMEIEKNIKNGKAQLKAGLQAFKD
jgi:hypothetical protein